MSNIFLLIPKGKIPTPMHWALSFCFMTIGTKSPIEMGKSQNILLSGEKVNYFQTINNVMKQKLNM
jgi:hypothetical protein